MEQVLSCLLLMLFLSIMFAYSQIFDISQLGKTHHNSVAPNLESIRTGLVHWGWSKWSADHLPSWRSSKTPSLLLPKWWWFGFHSELLEKWTLRVSGHSMNWTHQETASKKIRGWILSAAFCCHLLLLLVSRSSPEQSFSILFRSCSNWRRQAIFCAALWRSSPHDKFETLSDHWKNWSW